MKTNKFTTQKLFCTLLFNLLVMGVFAQFTPNAAGAPEEPIPEPEVEGASCETAFETNVSQQEEFTFNEGQESMFFTFNAINDTMQLVVDEAETGQFAEITKVEVFEIEDCNNLSLIYDKILPDSISVRFLQIDELHENAEYLLKLSRNPDADMPESYFNMIIDELSYPFPNNYNLNCGEMVKNGGFNYLSWNSSNYVGIFAATIVCEWTSYEYTPDLIDKNNKTYAFMWADNALPPGAEEIVTSVDITPGNYMFSVELVSNHNTFYAVPDEFRVILRDNSTTPYTETVAVSIPQSQIQRRLNGNDVNFPFVAVCFNANQNYDEVILKPFNYSQNNSVSHIYIDNVSIKPITLDAGPDISMQGCEGSAVIGPSCVLPGATYSWTPTTGLSNPNIANPTINGAQSGTYTLTMTTACTTLTDQINVTSSFDEIIPDGQTSTWLQSLHGSSQNPERISGKNFLVEGEFIINSVLEMAWCELVMAEGAKITISGGGELDFHGGNSTTRGVIRSCQPDKFWDGIYVSGADSGHADFREHTVIRNSMNGIVIEDGSYSHVENVKFVNNHTAITYKNYSTLYGKLYGLGILPIEIRSCEFSANSYFTDEFGYLPTYAVKIINFQLTLSNGLVEPLLVRWNTFNGTGGGLYIENSNVNVQSNGFHGFYKTGPNLPGNPSRSDLAIRIKGSQTVSGSKGLTINSNTFNNCYFGIETEYNFIYRIRNNTFNGSLALLSETGPGTNFLKMSNNFSDADPSTTQNQIENNTIKNVEKGIILETVSEFSILDNTFDMEVQALPSSYPQRTNKNSRAIYVNNYDIPLSTYDLNTPRYISRNQIKHSKVGIQSSFVSSLTISENNIFNSNDNMSSTCPSLSPFTCPPLDPFGIRVVAYPSLIEENEISNELSLYTNNQPYQQSSDMMVGISVENTNYPYPSIPRALFIPGLYCNKIENTGVAMRFLGSNLGITQVLHNTMENHYYGFVLKNNGFIGDVGSDGNASDNEWKGSYTGSETLADDSDGSYCTLFVQNGGVYDPSINPIDRLNGG